MIAFVGQHFMATTTASLSFLNLVLKTFKCCFTPPYRWREVIHQVVFVAVESLPVVLFCVSAAAMVTIIESSFHMKIVVQNDTLVPGFAALLIIRELGSVITALLLTARVGAGIAAEVGTMKITEQIDAYKMLGLNPVKYLVAPRFIACCFGGVLITLVANIFCLFCAMLVTQFKLGLPEGVFWLGVRNFVSATDLVCAGIKGLCFGAVIPLFSCYYGFKCEAGAEGVGQATTKSVVATSVAIIIIDFLLSWMFSYIN